MSLSRQRITLVTLAVADMARARAFYEGWGWTPHSRPQPGVTFYQMNGAVLALFGRADLAADQGRPDATLGTGAVTLAQNCADDAETDAVFQAAVDAGATVLKRPEKVFWGGYSGVAHHDSWLTPTTDCCGYSTNWLLSMDQNALYRANRVQVGI